MSPRISVMRTGFCLLVVVAACAACAQEVAKTPARLLSTYDPNVATWLRGNLHTHTNQSDGAKPPQEVVDVFARLGYDFLVITDHDMVTPVDSLDSKGMTLIAGNEISANGPHLLHVDAKTLVPPGADRQAVIDQVAKEGGFAIFNHPNWTQNYNHCPLESLEKWQGYTGIEIYNGVILVLEGSELATDKWDRLLAQGRRIYGFATDDSHAYPDHAGMGWVMVQSDSRTPDDIVAAMQTGRFYSSTGVTVDAIDVQGLTVSVRADNAQKIRVIGDNGRVLQNVPGPATRFTASPEGKYTYIRFEFYGAGDAMAWLQPMFLE